MSSSCGWRDQESQRRQSSLPKEVASRGDLELEEWLNTPAKYALGHENYSELKALEKQKVQGRCSDLALFFHQSSCWDPLWAELTDIICTGPLLWERAGDKHREEPGEEDGKIPPVSVGCRDSLTQRKALPMAPWTHFSALQRTH